MRARGGTGEHWHAGTRAVEGKESRRHRGTESQRNGATVAREQRGNEAFRHVRTETSRYGGIEARKNETKEDQSHFRAGRMKVLTHGYQDEVQGVEWFIAHSRQDTIKLCHFL